MNDVHGDALGSGKGVGAADAQRCSSGGFGYDESRNVRSCGIVAG